MGRGATRTAICDGNPAARVLRTAGAILCCLPAMVQAGEDGLSGLSLEELGDLQVTSVSRVPEPLRQAPAAIYVITQDDIRRSGATTLAEALQLAPNLRVMQLGSSNYSLSTRGFGGNLEAQNFSNKLLLLIDGRSVYSPLFSGIFMDSHDVLLGDVARIEVISGPGGMLWGANAMHGVINVITRPAYLTEGTALAAGVGNDEQLASMRFGGSTPRGDAYRVYGKAQRRDAMNLEPGASAGDSWHKVQAGFRMDIPGSRHRFTLQGDTYKGNLDEPGLGGASLTGANLLGSWRRSLAGSSLEMQGYFDHVQRDSNAHEGVRVNTLDFEMQHDIPLGQRHSIVWGGGVRMHRYQVRGSDSLQLEPAARSIEQWNVFGQGTAGLSDQVRLTLGLKLEHNPFSGWEPQPEMRLAWQVNDSTLLWASAARAIRSPTPFDTEVVELVDDMRFLVGDPDFRPEVLQAFDVGFRFSAASGLWLSVSAFYNQYDDLRTVEWGEPPTYLPLRWGNQMQGNTYGINAWATWQVTDWWRLTPGFELLRKDLRLKDDAFGPLGVAQAGNDPRGHARLASSMDIGNDQMLEIAVRHVGRLPDPELPAHTQLSVRYAWQVSRSLELSLRGANLLQRQHRQYPAAQGRLIRRAVMAEARWRH